MLTLDQGRILVGERLYLGAGDAVHRGSLASDPSARFLVTLTGPHAEPRPYAELAIDGVACVEWFGPGGAVYADALVERLPSGRPASDLAALVDPTLARVGAAIARVIAAAHGRGERVGGIRPELIYLADDNTTFAQLVPRGPELIASAPQRGAGLRSYHVPYLAPEVLGRLAPEPASDVFALGASLFALGTGAHPFGDPRNAMEIANRIMTGRVSPWPRDRALGELLLAAMASPVADRPRADELATRLDSIA